MKVLEINWLAFLADVEAWALLPTAARGVLAGANALSAEQINFELLEHQDLLLKAHILRRSANGKRLLLNKDAKNFLRVIRALETNRELESGSKPVFETYLSNYFTYEERNSLASGGDAAAADDLVQDCLERAWSRFRLWRRGSNMRAWLFTIMHNIHANALRKAHSRPSHLVLTEDIAGTEDPRQQGVFEALGLARALARLPEDQRAVVLLVGLEDMSYAESAEILGVPVGTVRSRLARGRERLRRLTGDDEKKVVTRIK